MAMGAEGSIVQAEMAGRGYGEVLWAPSAEFKGNARVSAYCRWLASERGLRLADYGELWSWSVTELGEFWSSVWDYFGVLGNRGASPAVSGSMPQVSWFPGATLNYARNALRAARKTPEATAVIYRSEAGRNGTLTYAELEREVARAAAGLASLGVGAGDRVAAYLPNCPEALIGLLATASLGAVWSSCSPDFGVRSATDRFAQISPKVLIGCDGYVYGGKPFRREEQVAGIAAALPGLRAVITVEVLGQRGGPAGGGPAAGGPSVRQLRWEDMPPAAGPPRFAEVPFGHPLWVLYSSGTTGLPKPILHSHGGIVLEHLKTLTFHQDLGPGDVFLWYTTTGWMMWNYLAGGLLTGSAVVCYDGSAVHPETGALWALAAETGVSYAGFGAPYLLNCAKAGLRPALEHDLKALRGIGSTGSPLPPEGFRWVYDAVVPAGQDVILGSFSGGTDLCTGFVGPCPLLPVRAGVISGRCLGASVEAYDEAGRPVTGEVGELVITAAMPSMPVGFWNDPTGERYAAAYFAHYPGVWRHGDWIMILPDGGCVIYGRSDATLNRGGVRMGTSEFYRVVEALPEVADSLVIDTGRLGQQGRLILYVVLAPGARLDEPLKERVKSALRSALSPRHVPDEIREVPGIPRTLSGKKLEVPVRKIVLGTPPERAADPDALANPEVLAHFVPGGRP